MSIHPKDVLFFAGGDCLQRFGVPVMRQTRAQDAAATFTRSGAVGPFVGKDGVLRSASANRLRVDWIDTDDDDTHDTPTLLLEAARTNVNSVDDLTSWTQVGTGVSAGSVSDPAGGTGAYTIADDDGASSEYVYRAITFTGDAVKSVVFVVRENTMATSGVQRLNIYDSSAAASRLQLDITAWVGGEPSITANAGTHLGSRYIGNGYWAVYGRTTSVTAANSNVIELVPANTTAATGSIDVYRVCAYDAVDPPLSILDQSEALGAETFYSEYLHTPQALTVYLKFYEWVNPNTNWTAAYNLLRIGNAGGTGARLSVYRPTGSGDVYTVQHVNDAAGSVDASVDVVPTWGDSIELCARLYATGAVDIIGSNGGAAEVSASATAANTLASAWADTRLYLSHPDERGIAGFEAVKIARGAQSMADMRALFAYDTAAAA